MKKNEKVYYFAIPQSQKDEAEKVLKENDILIDGIYFDVLDPFCINEAEYRLTQYEEDNGKIEDTTLRDSICNSLRYNFLEYNESFISGDALCDMTDEIVKNM